MLFYKPLRFCVELDSYHQYSTVDHRLAAVEVHGGFEQMLFAALWASCQMFSMYGFDLNKAMETTEDLCYEYFYEQFSHDDTVDEYHAAGTMAYDAVMGVVYLIPDVYPAVLRYAERVLEQGCPLEWVKDAVLEINWRIASSLDEEEETWEEVYVIAETQPRWRSHG